MELQSIGIKWVYRGFDKKIEAHVCIGQTFQFWDGLHGHDTLETCEFDPWTQTLTRMWTPGKKHHRPDGLVKALYRFTANGDLEITTTFNPTGVTFKAYWRKCTGHPVQLQYVQPGQTAQPQYGQTENTHTFDGPTF